jgi:ribose transport system substrate-binding protein
MKPLPVLSSLVVAGLLLSLAGCAQSGKLKVAFVTNNPAEFWTIVEKGASDAAEKGNVELMFRRPANGTAAEQKQIIDTLLPRGVKAISISVIDPENQTEFLDTVAAKVPLLAIDNDAEKSKRRCYIGTDNVKAGRAVGKLVKEALPNGGVVALFVGQIEPINARERVQGVLEELGIEDTKSKDGKYRLHRKAPYTDNVQQNEAKKNAITVLAALQDEPNICLVGLWAYNPPAILSAAKEVKKEGKVKIVAFDEDLETLKGIDDGYIHATVVQNPYDFGRRSVEVMAALAKGEDPKLPANGKEYIPERIVTKEGGPGRLKASEFRKDLEKLMGK